jgi:quercetin dioxygenase-like cupin family protein
MHESIKTVANHVGTRTDKFYKTTLFQSNAMLLGINCLEPRQVQKAHDHADQDKFYYIVEGEGVFTLGDELVSAETGQVVWAAAGVIHGVANESDQRLTLLVGIAPGPT